MHHVCTLTIPLLFSVVATLKKGETFHAKKRVSKYLEKRKSIASNRIANAFSFSLYSEFFKHNQILDSCAVCCRCESYFT